MEGAVKHLTDLAVTISAEDATTTELSTIPAAGNAPSSITKIIPLLDKRLKSTNLWNVDNPKHYSKELEKTGIIAILIRMPVLSNKVQW